ncbi:MAG: pyridoxamine 5'-phosphate oxidase family protein [Maritimibacter sp.]|nr:pyridoxamine 5'-phosphate oxidase family protein [Maritimibacter sp.]
METIDTIAALEALYDVAPSEAALVKVTDHLTPSYRAWIGRAQFVVLSTVGPEGVDGSPRGDAGPVVTVADARTLLLPDWRGNNRLDSLRNIVRDGRVALMFLVAGSNNAMRVNGTAVVSADPALTGRFEQQGQHPRSVIVVRVAEVYSQCARALVRSAFWTSGDRSAGLPSVGTMLADAKAGFDGAAYDAGWAERAKGSLW